MNAPISPSQLLDSLSGRTQGEVYQVHSSRLPLTFRSGELESIRAIETAGRALRVIQNGRLGFSTSTDLSDGTALVRNALESAQFGDPVTFDFPAQRALSTVQVFDATIADLDSEQLIDVGDQIVDLLKAYDAEMQIDVHVDKTIDEIELLNTNGLHLTDRRTTYSIAVEVTKTSGDDILMVEREATSRRKQDVDGPALAAAMLEQLGYAKTIAAVTSRPMPVVFRGLGILPLFLPLVLGLDGRQVYLGTSPLAARLGQPVFDSRFTLNDDGLAAGGAQSSAFDDEGIPTSSKPLVEHGIVHRFLYDLKTAAQAGAEPTGNGFKTSGFRDSGYHLPPAVAPTAWIVSPGSQKQDEILAGFDEALLVDEVIGLGQGNIHSGEFSNNVGLGFLVRRGEIVGRIKNTMIAGNVYELLKDHLVALSNQAEWVVGTLQVPAIAIENVAVTSK